MPRRVENPDVIDFGKIVILGRQPEDRHGRDSARVQILGQARRRERFINGVRRTRKQTDLLPGEDRYGPGLGEARDQSVPRILRFQNSCDGRAAIIRILDLARRRGVRFPMVRIVAVKARDAVKMIGEIGKKLRGAGDLSVT